MARRGHGEVRDSGVVAASIATVRSFAASVGLATSASGFGYMFDLTGEDHRLPTSPETVEALKQLGSVMFDRDESTPGSETKGDGPIPAAYTYFGQFVDHDITFDEGSGDMATLSAPDLKPLSSLAGLSNSRTAHLDLDSVYDGPRDGDRMLLSSVTKLNGTAKPLIRPPGKADQNDLPREGRSEDPRTDRAARIGDPRNDENLIVSQLHVAFLKAHNALVAGGMNFEAARRAIRQRYQWIVLHDFLKKVCDEAVLSDVIKYGPKYWKVEQPGKLFIPAEFAAAGYRFGHSMIRTKYDFNLNFNLDPPVATLALLFTFTALSGQLGENVGVPQADTLPENWIIQWERILPTTASKPQLARAIDARLTDFTFKLQDTFGNPEGEGNSNPEVVRVAPQLAIRNLLRGYLFGLPTGQAVARAMNVAPLSGDALLKALPNDEIRAKAGPFAERTPLWFYILAEAGDPAGAAGRHLGTVGSRIVAETFWNLIRHSEDSILQQGANLDFDSFTLVDLINLAGREDVPA